MLLQRPTILAKPAVILTKTSEQENLATPKLPITILNGNKDENAKPYDDTRKISKLSGGTDEGLLIRQPNETTAGKPSATILAPGKNGSSQVFYSTANSSSGNIAQSRTPSKSGKEATVISTEKPVQPTNSLAQFVDLLNSRLASSAPCMNTAVRLLDENLQWQDGLNEFLTDQNDYVVVGVLGKKGVGKSTIVSMLGGSAATSKKGNLSLFKTANRDSIEQAQHRTSGISAFVTNERTILLDVQPLMSGSVLDKTIAQADKKHFNVDFKYFENYIEIQSIEITCFILSVCNVVLVAEDWFSDPNLFRLLQTAEMLMPNMNTAYSQNTSTNQVDDLHYEHHPHLGKNWYFSSLK